MACGVLRKAKEKGLKVPEDLAVVGCNNTSVTPPGLSTLDVFGEKIGKFSAEMLLDIIGNKKIEQSKVVIKPELIIRETCGAQRL